tara:strand:+ start:98 stop:481 length:384 start_codon:yes stop_codon:yes gene_type:complete
MKKKIEISIETKHVRQLSVAHLNIVLDDFAKNYQPKLDILAQTVAQSTDQKTILEAFDNLQDHFVSMKDNLDCVRSYILNFENTNTETAKNKQDEYPKYLPDGSIQFAEIGKKGAKQLPDGSWEKLD